MLPKRGGNYRGAVAAVKKVNIITVVTNKAKEQDE